MESFKTVQQVAKENGCEERTVQLWCSKNDVPYVGTGKRKQYLLYPEHEKRFINREGPGRRWPKEK
jgi:hypothetical protein